MASKALAGIALILLLIGSLTLVFEFQSAKGAGAGTFIYIRADGSVDPPTAPIQRIGDTYRLTNNILNKSIEVQRDNIVLDGNGFLLQGFLGFPVFSYYGIYLSFRQGVTVKNVVISDFVQCISLDSSSNNEIIYSTILSSQLYGIRLSQSNHNILASNVVKNTYEGISLYFSSNNTLSGNTATDNEIGMRLLFGTNNKMRNNVMARNKNNFDAGYYFLEYYIQDVDTSNTVDGKPIYYWINRHDATIPLDAGVVIIVNSSRITVRDLKLKNNLSGVKLAFTTDSLIESVTATENANGIMLDRSDSNVITRNNITDNDVSGGISLVSSAYNYLTYNFVSNTNSSGIWLEDTNSNIVIGNTVINSSGGSGQEWDGAGVMVDDSTYCQVMGNTLIGNWYGIVVGGGWSNLVVENNVERSDVGLMIAITRDNPIYHNNFIGSKKKDADISYYGQTSRNTLDNNYPSGGNYWSDYTGWDANADGIGDSPYIIDPSDQDRYPLMSPYGGPPLPTYTLTITAASGGTTNPPPGSYRHSQGQKIPVNATPSTGYVFDHWELDGVNVGSSNPVNIMMNSNHSLRAIFAVPTYSVSLTAHCNAEGVDVSVSITMDGSPTGYSTPKTFTFPIGTHTFTVPTTDSEGHPFKQWNTGETNPTVTVSSSGMFTAYYDMKYTLTITNTAGGITNPAPGTHDFWAGTLAHITALPQSGYYLDYWQLDGVKIGAPNPAHILMNSNHTLHATFKQLTQGHDVAIKYIESKTVVGQELPLTVKVTAVNVGSYTENFNVTLNVGALSIASETVTLESGGSTVINFTWNTTGFARGNYTVGAQATPVAEETNTDDNTYVYGWVIVAMLGDISGPNGVPDGIVDIDDLIPIAVAYASSIGQPRYNPNCDINNDGIIDIDDIMVPAIHYGEQGS